MGEEQAFGFPRVLATSFVRILVFKEQYLEVGLGVVRRLKLLPDTKPREINRQKNGQGYQEHRIVFPRVFFAKPLFLSPLA